MRADTARLLVAPLTWLLAQTVWAAVPPQAVSPGAASGFAAAAPCPVFTWSLAEGASGYELAVFGAEDFAADGAARPVLRIELPGGVGAWSAPADRCLAPGERYAWSVRAVTETARVRGAWSEALLFEVAGPPSDLAAALDVLRRHLGSDALGASLGVAGNLTRAGSSGEPLAPTRPTPGGRAPDLRSSPSAARSPTRSPSPAESSAASPPSPMARPGCWPRPRPGTAMSRG